jgi:hypothetical protein
MDLVLGEHGHWYGALYADKSARILRCDHPHACQVPITPLAMTTVRVSGNVRNAQNDCADDAPQRVVASIARKYGPILATVGVAWVLLWLRQR